MSIYDQIKHDIAQEYYQNNYSNDGQRFIAWYLRNICSLDIYDAKDCITDGAGDKQIDAVYINDDEQTIYILQGKFIQKAKTDSAPLMEIYSAWLQVKDLQNLQENANDKLAGKVSEISSALNDGYDLCFQLVMTSELTKAAQKDFERYRQELSDYSSLNAVLSVIGSDSLERLYREIAINSSGIKYDFRLEPERFMDIAINGTRAVIAVLSLTECVNIPGINDGSLFRRNVRQSLGKSVKVNKEIAQSLKNNSGEFFFLHNGITAICSSLKLDGNILHVEGLSVVNGCQSLTAIFSSSEKVKKSNDGYIIFRFYEIADNERAEKISTSTNSQNAVKSRDLRSNDKYVLMLKRAYEQYYPDGVFITKRGEKAPDTKNKAHVVELGILGKMLMTWHMQRPTVVLEESVIFNTHFNLLFHRPYTPENVQALNEIFTAVLERWKSKDNPLDFNEELLKHKAYVPYWHLFAVSLLLSDINRQPDSVPNPDSALKVIKASGRLDEIIERAGNCVNEAFIASVDEAHENNKVFNSPNWCKSSKTIRSVHEAVRKSLRAYTPDTKQQIAELKESLKMSKRDFMPIWRPE